MSLEKEKANLDAVDANHVSASVSTFAFPDPHPNGQPVVNLAMATFASAVATSGNTSASLVHHSFKYFLHLSNFGKYLLCL